MSTSLDCLQWQSMTATVNEIKSPNAFLQKKLFGYHELKETQHVEVGFYVRGRTIAPFVKRNGSALVTSGHSTSFKTIEPVHIRIKRMFTPSELLYGRRPGGVIFASGSNILSAAREHVTKDLAGMADDTTNSVEWLSALALRGSIDWESADDAFTVDFARPAGNTVVLTGDRLWDSADPTLVRPDLDFHTVKRILTDEVGLNPTDALFGEEAVNYFLRLVANHPLWDNTRRANVGSGANLTTMFNEDGVIYLGNFMGVDCWEYSRTATVSGTDEPMVRSKYVEFVAATPGARNTMFFGAVSDLIVLEGQSLMAERFSKSWKQDDPSAMWALLSTSPLPVPLRPGSMVSMKVVSG